MFLRNDFGYIAVDCSNLGLTELPACLMPLPATLTDMWDDATLALGQARLNGWML